MDAQFETCHKCNARIGRIEQTYQWRERVVCEACYKLLSEPQDQDRLGIETCSNCGDKKVRTYGWNNRPVCRACYRQLSKAASQQTVDRPKPSVIRARNTSMKIAELEEAYNRYSALTREAQAIKQPHEVHRKLDLCKTACEYLDLAHQYIKRKPSFEVDYFPVKTICTVGPVLFEHDLLLHLQEVVSSSRILSKLEGRNFNTLHQAFWRERDARTLWNILEANPRVRHCDLKKLARLSVARIDYVINLWSEYRIIRVGEVGGTRTIEMTTKMEAETLGICVFCSAQANGKRRRFCQQVTCPRCMKTGFFHIAAA